MNCNYFAEMYGFHGSLFYENETLDVGKLIIILFDKLNILLHKFLHHHKYSTYVNVYKHALAKKSFNKNQQCYTNQSRAENIVDVNN